MSVRTVTVHPQRFTEAVEALCVAGCTLYNEDGLLIMHSISPTRAAMMVLGAIVSSFNEPVLVKIPEEITFLRDDPDDPLIPTGRIVNERPVA